MPDPTAIERRGPVGICTLQSPETRNALDTRLAAALIAALQELDADQSIRCIVIAGSEEVFASDPEIRESAEPTHTLGENPVWDALVAIEKPVIAAVSGWALGKGFELALACDLIIASESARFGLPEITLGQIPSGGATQRLPRLIGRHKTMELVLTGRRLTANEAAGLGLVNQVVKRKDWPEQAVAMAVEIAARAPVAVRLGKRAVNAAGEVPLAEGLATERRLAEQAHATHDRVEGYRALLEGRPPEFEGH